jgi:hypothetical protein
LFCSEQLTKATEQLQELTTALSEQDPGLKTYQRLTSLLDLDLRVQLQHSRHLLSCAVETQKEHTQRREVLAHRHADSENRLASVRQQITALEQKELPQGHREVCYWKDQLRSKANSTAAPSSESNRDGLLRQKRKVQCKKVFHNMFYTSCMRID